MHRSSFDVLRRIELWILGIATDSLLLQITIKGMLRRITAGLLTARHRETILGLCQGMVTIRPVIEPPTHRGRQADKEQRVGDELLTAVHQPYVPGIGYWVHACMVVPDH